MIGLLRELRAVEQTIEATTDRATFQVLLDRKMSLVQRIKDAEDRERNMVPRGRQEK